MRHEFRPTTERLESFALLSTVPAVVSPPPVMAPQITLTLTTDKPVYNPGDVVHMTVSETNNTNHDITIADGPSLHEFEVTQNGAVVWRSSPGFQPLFLRMVTLHPGQSLKFSATWNGRPNDGLGNTTGPALTGSFQVKSTVRQGGAEPAPVSITIGPSSAHTSAYLSPIAVPTTPTIPVKGPLPPLYNGSMTSGYRSPIAVPTTPTIPVKGPLPPLYGGLVTTGSPPRSTL
jgi:hypothetical protein